ncbi:hypothetical protein BRADI_3g21421v3 [Brachypodium distachyon]|uniref:RNase H type-1 domain-containing protein n=1 Tax=Brachypodium distachyon TaxID=15368 RepID=A0A2K2CYM9_BRADI|nr:hypothetical protein BRADI_3g21421v3 [Brachypodium distachyon]
MVLATKLKPPILNSRTERTVQVRIVQALAMAKARELVAGRGNRNSKRRQAWLLIDKSTSLCARVLKAKYFPNGSLVDTVFTGNASSSWQAIEFGLELIKEGVIWRIGNGQNVRIWRDPWIPRNYSRRPISPRRNCRLRWVSELLTPDGKWNMERLNNFFLPIDIECIVRIKPSIRNEQDFLAWHPDKRGQFSMRSAYHLGRDISPTGQTYGATSSRPDGSSPKWKSIWNDIVPRKVNIFAWKLSRDALATQVNLCNRKMEKVRTCQVCGGEDEDSFHALVRCPNARAIWHAMRSCWDIPDPNKLQNTGPGWFLHALSTLDKTKVAMLLMMFWRIWHVHNDIMHDKTPAPVVASRRLLCSYMDSLLLIKQNDVVDVVKGKQVCAYSIRSKGDQKRDGHLKSGDARWKPPDVDSVKLNMDGSFSPDNGSAGIGIVLHNHRGEVIFSACSSIPHCTGALKAELKACEEGLRAALGWSEKFIILESDCAETLSMACSKHPDRSPYAMCVTVVGWISRGVGMLGVSRPRTAARKTVMSMRRKEEEVGGEKGGEWEG